METNTSSTGVQFLMQGQDKKKLMAVENISITFRSSNQQETLSVSFSDSCDIIWNNSAVTPQLL